MCLFSASEASMSYKRHFRELLCATRFAACFRVCMRVSNEIWQSGTNLAFPCEKWMSLGFHLGVCMPLFIKLHSPDQLKDEQQIVRKWRAYSTRVITWSRKTKRQTSNRSLYSVPRSVHALQRSPHLRARLACRYCR